MILPCVLSALLLLFMAAPAAAAIQLLYGGANTVLSLQETASGATSAVTISESTPGVLTIDLGTDISFDPASAVVPGLLTYQNGAPGNSSSATVNIRQAMSITTLQAALNADVLILGSIDNAAGGLGNVVASAGAIIVIRLDTRASNGNVDLKATGALTVGPNALLDTGTGTIALAAGVNADGTGSNSGGALSVGAGAIVVSGNTASDAITLRGTDIDIDTSNNPPLIGARLTTTPNDVIDGLDQASDLAVDSQNNFYVATDTNVLKFAPRGTTPTATLTGVSEPYTLQVDPFDNLLVTNFLDTKIFLFQRNTTTPNSNFTRDGLDGPANMVFDASGNLFVINSGAGGSIPDTISVFDGGSLTITRTLTGLTGPADLIFDSGGNLYVANAGNDTVSLFLSADLASGATTPSRTLTGLVFPFDLAVDADHNLYVCNLLADSTFGGPGTSVSVFAPGSITPTRSLTAGVLAPAAVAFDSRGNLYVANQGSHTQQLNTTISVFGPGGTTPIRTLTGPPLPGKMVFDSLGNLYVLSDDGKSVSIFTPTTPIPAAGGVVIGTAQPDLPIDLGATSGTGLVLSDAELAQIFTTATGLVTIGDATSTGDITVTGHVSSHPGYDTLFLQTQARINTVSNTLLAVANLALHAGNGIGTTGAMAIDAAQLAFDNDAGPVQLNDARAVTLTSVGPLSASSFPADVSARPSWAASTPCYTPTPASAGNSTRTCPKEPRCAWLTATPIGSATWGTAVRT